MQNTILADKRRQMAAHAHNATRQSLEQPTAKTGVGYGRAGRRAEGEFDPVRQCANGDAVSE